MQTKSKGWTRWIVWGGTIVSVTVLILLITSLFTTYTASKRQLARQYQSIVSSAGFSLDVIYPTHLLIEGSVPLIITLNVLDGTTFPNALELTFDLPPGIVISGTVNNPVIFEKRNGNYQQEILALRNSGVLTQGQSQVITVTHQSSSDSLLLSIEIESAIAAARRNILSSLLNEKGPSLLALAALLPVLGLILEQVQRQEDKEKIEREQKLAQQKQEILQQVKDLHQFLSQGNRIGVKRTWEHIQALLFPSVETIPSQERVILERLVVLCLTGSFADEHGSSTWIHIIKDEWLDELIGALVGAGDMIDANSESYRTLLRDIPVSRVSNLPMRNEFIRLWRKVDTVPLQNWPQEFIIKADAIKESPLERTPLHGMLATDPLLYDRAEDEETTLFERDGFWFGHPVYSAIANATQVQLVYGPPGCGRTALAKNLCHNESRWSRYFWVYRYIYPGLTDISILRSELAEQLLQYVLDKPTLFLPVQESTRRLLSEVLVEVLDKQIILARLEQAYSGSWLDKADTYQRPVWQKVGETQLALLSQSIEAVPEKEPFLERHWVKSFCNSLKMLDYRGVRFVLDFAPGVDKIISSLLPTLHEWQNAGLVTTLFLSGEALRLPELVNVPLHWSSNELDKMVRHRFLRLANCDSPTNVFANATVYGDFIQAVASDYGIDSTPTPRKLIQLWQIMLENIGGNHD